MSEAISSLAGLSEHLVQLVEKSAAGVVAVKGAAYRSSSGVAIGPDLVVTTDHTLKRTDRVPIVLAGGEQANASIVGRDGSLDVALLRVDGQGLKPLTEADPQRLRTGVLATVVGMTADVGATASIGIFGAVGESRRVWRGGTLDRFLRLDVNLYPSQSGAAVVNADGQLVGVATPALLRYSAVAVPVATLRRVAEELVKEGRIRRGYLGVGIQTVAVPVSLRESAAVSQEKAL
ncbi:MAG: trypsin-like peptidase domain-containing protein, partial [Acidobacteriaceae bacterium]|nr:trypsin-like peptidase domain-containing protein [Acidobacteriaceae bacterium]